ncbi:MAG: hypothetical protein AAB884_01895 [Patescibacteria group bacterium]
MKTSSGQIALPFILLVSGIIIEIAIAGSFVAYFLINSGLGERLALRAEAAAHAGLEDAIIRISQDKGYADLGENYSLDVNGDNVLISVSRVFNSGANIYVYTIISVATAGSREKKFVAVIAVNDLTGEIQPQSFTESSVQ